MFIKCEKQMDGPGPSEAIVAVQTSDGNQEEVVVDVELLRNGYLDVGPVLGNRNGETLIELPRESASGQWRVWVNSSQIRHQEEAA